MLRFVERCPVEAGVHVLPAMHQTKPHLTKQHSQADVTSTETKVVFLSFFSSFFFPELRVVDENILFGYGSTVLRFGESYSVEVKVYVVPTRHQTASHLTKQHSQTLT